MELPVESHPSLLVGMESSDDAGVYKLNDEVALVQTLDFFTPIVDDPYDFGCIAAANSLSDVYAMGGMPVTAMNIVCFPIKEMSKDVLRAILRGGLEKIHEAGAVLAGGHSVDDNELKYGLSVTGIVHPEKIISNLGARPGDQIILTKPIGIGILATAVKGKLASEDAARTLVEITSTLNHRASRVMLSYGPHACTDVTGFGLGGHLLEMARGSHVEITIYAEKVPVIPEAFTYASMGLVPAGTYATKHFCEHLVEVDPGVEAVMLDIIFDPQTSGGLVFAVPPQQAENCLRGLQNQGIEWASIIGEVSGLRQKGALRIL